VRLHGSRVAPARRRARLHLTSICLRPVFTDENIQRYVKALYPVALLLILVPLSDLSLRTFPPQFGSLQWRFQTVGLLLGNYGTIILGLALLGFVGVLRGNRTVVRVVGFVGLVMAVITGAIIALFVLDAVQMRQIVQANFKRVILTAGTGALFTALFGVLTFISIARGALAATRRGTPTAPTRPVAPAAGLVVGSRPGVTEPT
jgi:hypothetical protein